LRFGLPGSGAGVAASGTATLLWRQEDRTRLHSMLAGPVTLEKCAIATAVLTAFREICELRPYNFSRHFPVAEKPEDF
jgi:hypothetical protein